MNINGKRSLESFDPIFLVQFPECKRSETGIRPRNIKKFRLAKENIKKPSFTDKTTNDHSSLINKSIHHPHRFIIRSKIPFIKPPKPIEKQQNIAFFNFLPENDENFHTNLIKPATRCKSFRYSKESQSKCLQKLLKPKRALAYSEGGKRICTGSVSRTGKNEVREEEVVQTPNKWTENFNENSDEEESPLRDYSNVLKPRFNL